MFWENFYKLCSDAEKSPNSVARELSVASGTVTAWKNGKVPHHGTLLKLADYFGVTVDYLLGADVSTRARVELKEAEQKEKPADDGELSDAKYEWDELYYKLTDDSRELMIRLMTIVGSGTPEQQKMMLARIRSDLNN